MPAADLVVEVRGVAKDYRGLRPLRVRELELRQGESLALIGFDLAMAEVFVNLAPGERIQAWMQNEGGELPFESGSPVTVHFPPEALRVLPEAGTPIIESGELEEK